MSSHNEHIRSESNILRVHRQKGEGGLTEKSDILVDQNGNSKGHLTVIVGEGPNKMDRLNETVPTSTRCEGKRQNKSDERYTYYSATEE